MRQDEEKRPILPKKLKQGNPDKDYDGINTIANDFFDLSQNSENEKESSLLYLEPKVAAFSFGFILMSLAALVGMPTYIAGLVTNSSDPFAACFILPTWAMLITLTIVLIMRKAKRGTAHEISLYPFFMKRVTVYGLLMSIALILHAFCGVPSRTPAYIQAVSFIVTIPAACITEFALTRKAFTWRPIMCIMMVAIAITLVMLNLLGHPSYVPGAAPYMWRPVEIRMVAINNDNTFVSNATTVTASTTTSTANPLMERSSLMEHCLWSLGYCLGWALFGVAVVLLDNPIRVQGGNPMVVCLFAHLMTFIWIIFMFFVDCIPRFGWAVYLSDFRAHVHRGIKCLFGADSNCEVLAWRGWLEIFVYTGFYIMQFYVMSVADCPAIYSVLLTATAVPLVGLTWMLFADTGLDFFWHPSITPLATIIFIALLVAVLASVFYRAFSRQEHKAKLEAL